MNRFVDILNRIRQGANLDWLTPSQKVAYDLLRERLNFLDEVNLWGKHGAGKTFVGWMLYHQGLAIYYPSLKHVKYSSLLRTAVVDNMGWRRVEVLEALHQCRGKGFAKIVLITTEPVQHQIATVELQLTADDVEHATANLRSVGVAPYGDSPDNLWDLVSPVELDR
jgi:hypothetical protein